MGKLLPIPDISNKRFPEAAKHEEKGLHRIMFRWSPEDYRQVGEIWNGLHPEDGSPLEVQDGIYPTAVTPPDLDEEPQLNAPDGPDGPDPEMLAEYAKRLFGSNGTSVKAPNASASKKPSRSRLKR